MTTFLVNNPMRFLTLRRTIASVTSRTFLFCFLSAQQAFHFIQTGGKEARLSISSWTVFVQSQQCCFLCRVLLHSQTPRVALRSLFTQVNSRHLHVIAGPNYSVWQCSRIKKTILFSTGLQIFSQIVSLCVIPVIPIFRFLIFFCIVYLEIRNILINVIVETKVV